MFIKLIDSNCHFGVAMEKHSCNVFFHCNTLMSFWCYMNSVTISKCWYDFVSCYYLCCSDTSLSMKIESLTGVGHIFPLNCYFRFVSAYIPVIIKVVIQISCCQNGLFPKYCAQNLCLIHSRTKIILTGALKFMHLTAKSTTIGFSWGRTAEAGFNWGRMKTTS